VKADFDKRMERTPNDGEVCPFVASTQREENLLTFDRSGVSRIIEYVARWRSAGPSHHRFAPIAE
jgi:predicted ATP-dependent protease